MEFLKGFEKEETPKKISRKDLKKNREYLQKLFQNKYLG